MLIRLLGIFHQSWHLRFWLSWKSPFVRHILYIKFTQAKLSIGSSFNYDSCLLRLKWTAQLGPSTDSSSKEKNKVGRRLPQLTLLRTPLIHNVMKNYITFKETLKECSLQGAGWDKNTPSSEHPGDWAPLWHSICEPHQLKLMLSHCIIPAL